MKQYTKKRLESAVQYLKQTEPAVRNIFGILQQYFSILEDINLPVCIAPYTPEEGFGSAFKKRQRQNREANGEASERLYEYLGYRFSIDTLCGSILQIAYRGINLYSKDKVVPSELSSMIKPKSISKVARFCIGRTVRGIPIGLIIYAGRNQYNHWDEESLRDPINEFVFNILAVKHGITRAERIREPAFDLNNEMIQIYSSNIFFILDWSSYDAYLADMKKLLIPATEPDNFKNNA